MHRAAVDRDITGPQDALLAAAERELDLAFAHGADAHAEGPVHVGFAAGREVDHADADAVGDVEGGLFFVNIFAGEKGGRMGRTNPVLGELEIDVAGELDGVGASAVEDVLRGGTAEHDGPVVAVVGLDEDGVSFGVVAGDVAEGIPKAGSGELGDGAGGGHSQGKVKLVGGQGRGDDSGGSFELMVKKSTESTSEVISSRLLHIL